MPFISCTTLFLIVFPFIGSFYDISHKFRYNLSSILPKRPATVFSSSRGSLPFGGRAVVRCQGEDRADTFPRMTGSPLCHLFHLFFVSVGVWDVDGNATPCFLPQSQAYTKKQPSQQCPRIARVVSVRYMVDKT